MTARCCPSLPQRLAAVPGAPRLTGSPMTTRGVNGSVGVSVKLIARFLRTGSAQAFEHLNLLFIRL